MKGKKERIDTTPSAAPLTSSPFADLPEKVPQDLPKGVVLPSAGEKAAEGRAEVPFRIARTRKGGYPIFIERRAAGKTVTVIRNVSGDTESLLAMLKRHCAAGGKAFEDNIEIQGDHCAKVEALFRQKGL